MFGKERRKGKKAIQLITLCYDFTNKCVSVLCAASGKNKRDPEIRNIIESDDSVQFFFTVSRGLAYQIGLDETYALLSSTRTLMEFLEIWDDSVVDKGIRLHTLGEKRFNENIKDRNSKIQCAAALAISEIRKKWRIEEISIAAFVCYIAKIPYRGMTFEQLYEMFETITFA